MFCYDPKKDAWHEVKPANPIPPHKGWMGWMKLCYDAHHDCFIGMIGDRFYAFRHEPANTGNAKEATGASLMRSVDGKTRWWCSRAYRAPAATVP
jgi:hypothetical protein